MVRTIITVTATVETREAEKSDFGVVCSPAHGLLDDEQLTEPRATSMTIMALQSFLREATARTEITDPVMVKMGDQTLMVQRS